MAELYRVRWEVERFFRGWRGALRLDEVRRLANADSLDAALTASLLAAALAHDLTAIVNDLAQRAAASEEAAIPPVAPALAPPQQLAVRTFFAVALQLGRSLPNLVELTRAIDHADRSAIRRAARLIADGVLEGARVAAVESSCEA